jgi:predicted transcriptional regulator
LAKLAALSVEHLCRIETGKHTPTVPMIDKIDRALKQASKQAKRAAKKGR